LKKNEMQIGGKNVENLFVGMMLKNVLKKKT
jgi:hypothetical protein